ISPDAPLASLAAALVPRASGDEGIGRPLSPRERQILALAARGLPAKQVARQLGISPKTVEQHKTRIFAKLGVQNQTAAVSVAFRRPNVLPDNGFGGAPQTREA